MLAASTVCSAELEGALRKIYNKTSDSFSFTSSLEHYTRYDWMMNQSFCYNGKAVSMQKTLTYGGIGFSYNADPNMLNRET